MLGSLPLFAVRLRWDLLESLERVFSRSGRLEVTEIAGRVPYNYLHMRQGANCRRWNDAIPLKKESAHRVIGRQAFLYALPVDEIDDRTIQVAQDDFGVVWTRRLIHRHLESRFHTFYQQVIRIAVRSYPCLFRRVKAVTKTNPRSNYKRNGDWIGSKPFLRVRS